MIENQTLTSPVAIPEGPRKILATFNLVLHFLCLNANSVKSHSFHITKAKPTKYKNNLYHEQ